MECYHCSSIHPELVGVLPEFAEGVAAQYQHRPRRRIRFGGSRVSRSTAPRASTGCRASPRSRTVATTPSRSSRRCSSTWCPITSSSTGCTRWRRIARSSNATGSTPLTWCRVRPRRVPLGRAVPPGQRAGLRGLRANPARDVVAGLPQRRCTRSCRTPHRGVPQWVVSRVGADGVGAAQQSEVTMNGEPDLLYRRAVAPRVRRRDPRDHQSGRRQRRRGRRRGHPRRRARRRRRRAHAFDDGAWPATPVAERAALLDRVADLLQRDKEALAQLETRDTGKTLGGEPDRHRRRHVGVPLLRASWSAVEADRLVDVGDPR